MKTTKHYEEGESINVDSDGKTISIAFSQSGHTTEVNLCPTTALDLGKKLIQLANKVNSYKGCDDELSLILSQL